MNSDLLHIVGSWKQDEFVAAQAAILRVALKQQYFYPGDIPEDVAMESRQGVASNAWNSLRYLGLIERIDSDTRIIGLGIYGGRKRNTNPSAKGRWCAVYYLRSRPLAVAWLRRHGLPVVEQPAPKQTELAI